ncbi:hypothetical protein D1P53_000978 [Cryptococcus gattii VGV]|nr:hypothetical protein D1P53_000978 [Cryptococcus gattii VGV]
MLCTERIHEASILPYGIIHRTLKRRGQFRIGVVVVNIPHSLFFATVTPPTHFGHKIIGSFDAVARLSLKLALSTFPSYPSRLALPSSCTVSFSICLEIGPKSMPMEAGFHESLVLSIPSYMTIARYPSET